MDPITTALIIALAREGLSGALSIVRTSREPVTDKDGKVIAPNIGVLIIMREGDAVFEEVMGRPPRPDERPSP